MKPNATPTIMPGINDQMACTRSAINSQGEPVEYSQLALSTLWASSIRFGGVGVDGLKIL